MEHWGQWNVGSGLQWGNGLWSCGALGAIEGRCQGSIGINGIWGQGSTGGNGALGLMEHWGNGV